MIFYCFEDTNKFAYLIYLPFNQFIYLWLSVCVRIYAWFCLCFANEQNGTVPYISNAMDYSFWTNFVHSIHSFENLFTFILLLFFFCFISFRFYFQFDAVLSICAVCISLLQPSIFELCMWFNFFLRMHSANLMNLKYLCPCISKFTFGFTIRAHQANMYMHRKIYCLLWRRK